METAKETGSKKELTAPASMVRNTANGITILPPIGAGYPAPIGGRIVIPLAVFLTILAGAVSSFLEPVSFAVSIPVAVMGGFILKAILDNKQ